MMTVQLVTDALIMAIRPRGRTARKVYKTRDGARACVFNSIERFCNPRRRHSTLGYPCPVEFEESCASLTSRPQNRQQASSAPIHSGLAPTRIWSARDLDCQGQL